MKIQAKKYSGNPILTPRVQEESFEKACVYNPAAIVKDDKVYLLYRAEQGYYASYNSRIGLATSDDGFAFERFQGAPIIDLDENREEEKRGLEDPRIVRLEDGRYFLTYTAYAGMDEQGHQITLSGAFSYDLIHWERIGRLVPGREKAGAIVQEYKWQGKYVMYFGEGLVKVAFSEDLRNWEVREQPTLEPREGYFDSFLVEGGPPPIVTDEGILLIYNSSTAGLDWQGKKDWVSYQPGFAVFDKDDPIKLLYRSDEPILRPTEYWEMYGKVNAVVFTNALVNFKGKWLLYYGGADKSIGVAELTFEP